MTTTKAGKKTRGPYKKKAKPGETGADEQEPLDRFRTGAAASLGKEDATEEDVADHNELIDEEPATGQKRIPGQERKGNKKIEAQAMVVRDLQTQRQDLLDEEIKQRDKLTQMMQKAGVEQYDIPDTDLEAVIERGEPKAKVHRKKKVKLD